MAALAKAHCDFAYAANARSPPVLHVLACRTGHQAWGRFGLPSVVWQKRPGEVSLQPSRRITASRQRARSGPVGFVLRALAGPILLRRRKNSRRLTAKTAAVHACRSKIEAGNTP